MDLLSFPPSLKSFSRGSMRLRKASLELKIMLRINYVPFLSLPHQKSFFYPSGDTAVREYTVLATYVVSFGGRIKVSKKFLHTSGCWGTKKYRRGYQCGFPWELELDIVHPVHAVRKVKIHASYVFLFLEKNITYLKMLGYKRHRLVTYVGFLGSCSSIHYTLCSLVRKFTIHLNYVSVLPFLKGHYLSKDAVPEQDGMVSYVFFIGN